MSFFLYNSMTHEKEVFSPKDKNSVSFYVCGPTVYGLLHVGNFRGPVVSHMLCRWLENLGYQVKFVQNYTDVDDKILAKALELNQTPEDVANHFIKEYEKDFSSLGLKNHSENPKVSEFITQIQSFIERLIQGDYAYVVSGDVYFHVPSFRDYGKLSRKKIEELESGYRIDLNDNKRHPSDFALWKRAKENEISWDSPWGKGRPGWHIECSVMSYETLGSQIDIHGGGLDLKFPHHENEIAQSECVHQNKMARYWFHWNMLNLGDKKMSKSLGNIVTYRDFSEKYTPEVYKFLMLRTHYRSLLDFSEEQIQAVIGSLARFYSSFLRAEELCALSLPLSPVSNNFLDLLERVDKEMTSAMNDDLNTPLVWAGFYEVMSAFNGICRKPGKVTPEQKAVAEVYLPWMVKKGTIFALFQEKSKDYLRKLDDLLLEQKGLNREKIDQLVAERWTARENKDYKRSDFLRNQINSLGILLQDTAEGTFWEVQK